MSEMEKSDVSTLKKEVEFSMGRIISFTERANAISIFRNLISTLEERVKELQRKVDEYENIINEKIHQKNKSSNTK